MNWIFVLIIFTASIVSLVQVGSPKGYDAVLTPVSAMNLNVSVLRNTSDNWITLFSAEKSVGNTSNGLNLGIRHTVFKNGKENVVRVTGVIMDANSENFIDVVVPGQNDQEENVSDGNETALSNRKEEYPGVLRFHEKTGKNIVMINDRRTAYRRNPYDNDAYAGLLTNRPLMDGEIFQVKLDKIINQWTNYPVFIGVTLQLPNEIWNMGYVFNSKNGTWYVASNGVYLDGGIINGSYPLNMRNLPLGTTIGVMRKKDTLLNFFLNGVDMGVAAKYVPEPVYGFLDLANYAAQVSIVD